uniref:ATP synthase subunit a n=1 Tax=Alitta succinea TaxID=981110 RepID=A0A7G8JTJ7_ALISU|nr:ATP synthase F0 subunit 6 [Alitta succinea]QNJ33882.1 ATP synthase F0 subunit 6 [Alitta succinea]QNJ33895.1 ATP synthase F0 subunit 6 [Alitta succinea]
MMLDIFSSFDPGVNMINNYSTPLMFWAIIAVSISMFTLSMWITPSSAMIVTFNTMKVMNDQGTRTHGVHIKGFNSLLVALFMIIININLMGLLPSVFSYSSHLLFTLSFGLPLWLALIMSAIVFNPTSWIASLLPGGAPHWLNPFLVLIETISITVRPLTLSFRLAANMSAGHIVLTLIGTYCAASMFSSVVGLIVLFMIQVGYIMFEIGICFIQSYIFCLLLSLYSDDHT